MRSTRYAQHEICAAQKVPVSRRLHTHVYRTLFMIRCSTRKCTGQSKRADSTPQGFLTELPLENTSYESESGPQRNIDDQREHGTGYSIEEHEVMKTAIG